MRLRPNPPRMVTVVLALGLLALGLAIVFLPQAEILGLVREVGLPRDLERTIAALVAEQMVAYFCLAAAPLLLIAGSLVRGL